MSTKFLPVVMAACLAVGLTACGSGSTPKSGDSAKDSGEVTVTNCGKKVTYPRNAERLYVNDGSIIAMTLSAGARKQIAAVSSMGRDKEILTAKYGADTINSLHEGVKGYMTLESIIANKPDVVVAGWDYGFSEANNLTPRQSARQGHQQLSAHRVLSTEGRPERPRRHGSLECGAYRHHQSRHPHWARGHRQEGREGHG